jgi:signal transduction histidine kinase
MVRETNQIEIIKDKYKDLPMALAVYKLQNDDMVPVVCSSGVYELLNSNRSKINYRLDEIIGKENHEKLMQSIKEFLKGEVGKVHIFNHISNDNNIIVSCEFFLKEMEEENYVFLQMSLIDEITDNLPVNITIYETEDGVELKLIKVSKFYSMMLGVQPEVHFNEMKKNPFNEVHQEDVDSLKNDIKENIDKGNDEYEKVLRYWNRKTGSYKNVKIIIKILNSLDNKKLLIVNHIDMDSQYQAEKNLLLAIKYSRLQYMEWDFIDNILSIKEYMKGSGYKSIKIKDFYSKEKLSKIIHKLYVDVYFDELTKLIEGKQDETVIDNICLNSEGIFEWQRHNLLVTDRDSMGNPIKIIGTSSPINEQKEMEERLTTILTQYGLTTWLYYPRKDMGIILNSTDNEYDNTVHENFPDEFLSDKKIFREDRPKVNEAYNRVKAGEPNVKYLMRVDKGSGWRWLETNYTSVFNEEGEVLYAIGSSRDVTEEVNLRKEYYDAFELYKNINAEIETATIIDLNENKVVSTAGTANIFDEYKGVAYDKIIEKLAGFAAKKEDEEWILKFKGENAIDLYNSGERSFSREIMFLAPEGQLYFIEKVRLIKNPENGNIMMFFTANDTTKGHEVNTFLKFLASNRYDFAAIVNLSNKAYNYIYYYPKPKDKRNFTTVHGKGFFEAGKSRLIKYLGESRATEIIDFINPEVIIKKLNEEDEYTYIYHSFEGEKKLNKKLIFKYYDKESLDVGIIQQDVTEDFKIEKRRREVISEAFEEVKKANDTKNEFLSRMSHDMRTPMNAIIGMSEFGLQEVTDEKAREYFSQIKASSVYLMGLLNDILDMQRLEAGNIELKPEIVNLNECMINNINIIKVRASEKNIILKTTFNNDINIKYIYVDILRLNQILLNILNNAIKYTKSGGMVSWNIEYLLTKEGYIVNHTIEDNGIGMSEEYLKDLYTPFVRAKNKYVDQSEGVGLGLAISKKLVDAMGGNLDCKSSLGKGTVFNIILPIEIPEEADIKKALKNNNVKLNCENNLIGKRILLCEDVEINSRIVAKMLNPLGVILTVAKDGKEGLGLVEKNEYDLILMDIHMPVMDGLLATEKIREFDKMTPIVALSANAYSKDVENSLKAGMNSHLSKPVDRNELISEICNLTR